MADQVGNLLARPAFSEIAEEVRGYVKLASTLPRADLPWVPVVAPYSDPSDPSVFAWFVALDRADGRVWIVHGLLAEPLSVVAVTAECRYADGRIAELRTEDMRIRLGRMRDKAAKQLGSRADLANRGDTPEVFRRDAAALGEATTRVGRRGRAPLSDEIVEKTARHYLELFEEGVTTGIRRELAERLSDDLGKKVPLGTASSWLLRAKDQGWLTMAGQGRAGAIAGPRLLAEDERMAGGSKPRRARSKRARKEENNG